METLQAKQLTTSRGFKYQYYISPPTAANASSPAIVLHHGWPDSAHLWAKMVPFLSKLPNRLVIPDLLGYGGTDKPTDPKAYAYHLMNRDILDILDAEGIPKVITVGHDHGVGSASRFYLHSPERTSAMILLNVAYRPPAKDKPFSLEANNAAFTKAFGYPAHEYWNFFTEDDAADVMGSNLDRLWEFAHPATAEQMKQAMGVPGAPRRMMLADSIDFPTKPHAKDELLKAVWKNNLAQGGLKAPMQWYVAHTTGVQNASDKLIPDENMKVNVPFLFIGCTEDMVCRYEMIYPTRDAGLLPDSKIEVIEGVGHWPMYEKPEYTAGLIGKFIEEKGL